MAEAGGSDGGLEILRIVQASSVKGILPRLLVVVFYI